MPPLYRGIPVAVPDPRGFGVCAVKSAIVTPADGISSLGVRAVPWASSGEHNASSIRHGTGLTLQTVVNRLDSYAGSVQKQLVSL